MRVEEKNMIELLRSPWTEHFDFLLNKASSSLIISSPYIGREPCERIASIKAHGQSLDLFFLLLLTDLSRENLLSDATDAHAISRLSDIFPQMEIRFLPSLHAKVYIADESMAIVTSANMTSSGLLRNFEYGMQVTDGNIVSRIKTDITDYAKLGTKIDRFKLKFLSEISSELKSFRIKKEKSVKSYLRREFEKRIRKFDDEIIRTRAAGRAPHSIFADAILYLLSRKPMSTIELHPLIQAIHPDLCDDRVDRVIDGKHFGKKWKHAVRTAQQHLKKTGQIELRGELWYLRK